ncbi:MAG TPA: phosphoenolpyruvate--protein phosphotransferase [Chloroflexota bacterium]|nr:phosphoenolpyruvate--protein phosphotransferase [Chloroflexota bacterium]
MTSDDARVGIVVVSHSARLAAGVVELAREMAGPAVPIASAGGTAADEAALGTDVERIQRAIEAVYSDAGVLVLMDLGSALLTAEMAAEACPAEWQPRIRLGAAPLVEGAVAAAVQSRLGSPLDEVAAAAQTALAPKIAQLGGGMGENDESEAAVVAKSPAPIPYHLLSVQAVIRNPHGLHARPAARLVETAAQFRAEIQARNLSTGQGSVSARSLVDLATLGVRPGHRVEFSASGPDAAAALEAIQALAAAGFGEAIALSGLPGSPGVALGEAWFSRRGKATFDQKAGEPSAEWERLRDALERAREQTAALRDKLRQAGQTAESEIIATHLALLADETILAAAREAILVGRQPAAAGWQRAIDAAVARFEALPDEYARARAADLRDVGNRVLALLGRGPEAASASGPLVLIADDLGPAEVASLDRSVVRGIALARGAPTAHAAILARGLGIPAVVGLGPAILAVPAGTPLLVDGTLGTAWPNPDQSIKQRYAGDFGAAPKALASFPRERGLAERPSIPVLANVGSVAEARAAFGAGATGIGLLRTEFLFLGRATPPTEDEQAAAYGAIAAELRGRPVTIRTLDAGGDKPLPYLGAAREENPFLGRRSIRLSLARPDFFAAQLRAIARAAASAPVRVMFPLVATLDEWRAARNLLLACAREVRARGIAVPEELEVGIMVEVPAAALAAEQFAEAVDFFSIGTNDLTQYTMAADRGNPALASLADPLQPVVLRLIQLTSAAARARGKPVSVCGELAADPLAVPLLVGLGVDALSVAPPAVAPIRAAVSAVDAERARDLAAAAIRLGTAAEVRDLLAAGRSGNSERLAGPDEIGI